MKKLTSYPHKTANSIKANVIKSVCVGGRLIENYSPNDYEKVKAEINKWTAATKEKDILRMRGEFTIGKWSWIIWN